MEMTADLWKFIKRLWRGLSHEGMYEVLDYEVTLELFNRNGTKAQLRKREKVCYQQDHIIAYQDEAWADGEILLNYKCSPGVEVDRYKPGHKTLILISLRDMKKRGDTDEFNIQWDMKDTFLRDDEQWEVDISHRTKKFTFNVIFPKSRPPIRIWLKEHIVKRATPLDDSYLQELPDGRWQVSWSTDHPRLHEKYILKWDW